MARATRWTDEKLKALKLPKGKAEQRIRVEPGLYIHLRRRSDGAISKQWQYRAQVQGVRRWLSLGRYGEADGVGLAKAREELLRHHKVHEAAKKGEADHPVIAERFARKEAKEQLTVADTFNEWIADKRLGSARKSGKPVRQRSIDVLTGSFDADVRDKIGDAKVAKLTSEALRACIDAPRKRGAPGAAAHVYRMLRGLINFAISRGYIVGSDPMRGIANPKPYRPAPVVAANDAEIRTLLKTVDSSHLWAATKLAIEFQLLTGARPGEVRLATWKEIDPNRAVWTIPADRVKSGREFQVHLSTEALSVLERARALSEKADFIFPGKKGQAAEQAKPMEKMAVARALSRLAARGEASKKLRPHDLRRTFRTMLSRLDVQPHVAELCMNHQETETMRRVYDGHDYMGEMIAAWDKAGAHIASLRAGGAEVIPLGSRAA
jgi:integrase